MPIFYNSNSSIVEIKNVNGTSRNERSSQGTSWKEFWKEKSKRTWPERCCNLDCENRRKEVELVGAHVQIDNGEKRQYIVPFCKDCNGQSSDNIFRVYKRMLVPVRDEDE